MWSQDRYLAALDFAAQAHQGQKIPGGEQPYVIHLCQVAMEVMAQPEASDLSVTCALLHDTIEDTPVTFAQVEEAFGRQVADGVQALTKDATLPKEQQMADSLARIRTQPEQVWMVKLADRITNLQDPPYYWKRDKRLLYRAEAQVILDQLGEGHAGLAQRLREKIEGYQRFIDPS